MIYILFIYLIILFSFKEILNNANKLYERDQQNCTESNVFTGKNIIFLYCLIILNKYAGEKCKNLEDLFIR